MDTRILSAPRRLMWEGYRWLAARDEDGAVVTFTGKVRNHNLGDNVGADAGALSGNDRKSAGRDRARGA